MSVSETVAALGFLVAVISAAISWALARSLRSETLGFADVASRFRLSAPFTHGDTLQLTFTTNGKRRSFFITFPEDLAPDESSAVLADAAQKLHAYIVSQKPLSESTIELANRPFRIKETTAPAQ